MNYLTQKNSNIYDVKNLQNFGRLHSSPGENEFLSGDNSLMIIISYLYAFQIS